jgi:hypothetical protein
MLSSLAQPFSGGLLHREQSLAGTIGGKYRFACGAQTKLFRPPAAASKTSDSPRLLELDASSARHLSH